MENEDILKDRAKSINIDTIKEFIILMNIIGVNIDNRTAIKIILATDLFAKQKTELRLSDCADILTESQKLINKFCNGDV